MRTRPAPSSRPTAARRSAPSNVIPFLAARPRVGCGPLELAAALRRLHRARLRGGFVLVAPVRLDPAAGIAESDPAWWSRLCDRIREQTRLRVALVDVATGDGNASAVARQAVQRAVAIGEAAPGERAALIELSRGVCTRDPELLAEASAMGVSTFLPDQLDAAARNGTLFELFAHPIAEALPVSA